MRVQEALSDISALSGGYDWKCAVAEHKKGSVRRKSSNVQKPASIYDVAAFAHVSAKTVSMVVNGLPGVRDTTHKRVMEAVETLSYRPNVFARGLVNEGSVMLGLLCDVPAAGSGYIARIQLGILTICHRKGYHLIVECLHTDNPNIDRQVHSLVAESRLTGVILTPPLSDYQELIDALKATHTSIARIAPERPAQGLVDVQIDNRKASYEMTAYLIGLGHKRIGFIKGPADHGDAIARFDGYRAALADAELPYLQELCVEGLFTYKTGMQAGDRLLALKERPTAIFASNDDMAAAVIATSLRFNLRVPGDLSVAGFDDSLFAQAVWPRLTTCRQPIEEMAEAVVSMLIQRRPESTPRELILKHTLIVRGSTAPPGMTK